MASLLSGSGNPLAHLGCRRRRRKIPKCTQCRGDKKKCEPGSQGERGKCARCEKLGHECGARLTAENDESSWNGKNKRRRKSTADSASTTTEPAATTSSTRTFITQDGSSSCQQRIPVMSMDERDISLPDSPPQTNIVDPLMRSLSPLPNLQQDFPLAGDFRIEQDLNMDAASGEFSREVNNNLDAIVRDGPSNRASNSLEQNFASTTPSPNIPLEGGSMLESSIPSILELEAPTLLDGNWVDGAQQRDLMLWDRHKQRDATMRQILATLEPLLATLREARAKSHDHKHKPPTMKPRQCPSCHTLLTVGHALEIKTHIHDILEIAKEALEDDDQSQAELLFLKAQSAMVKFTNGSYDDEETTVITLKLIKLYQDRNSLLEAELYIEILAKREKDTKSLTRAESHTMLIESLKKTTSEVCRPIEKYALPLAGDEAEGSAAGTPFTLIWRATSRKILPRLEDVDVRERDSYGNTALHECIRCNEIATVRELVLRAGADPFARNSDQQTPLEVACIIGSLEIVQFLVQHQEGLGNDIMRILEPQVFRGGSTPMHSAIEHRWPDIVSYLLKKGARPDKIWMIPETNTATEVRTPIELAASMVKLAGQSMAEKERSQKIFNILIAHTSSKYFNTVGQRSFLDGVMEDPEESLFGGELEVDLGASVITVGVGD